MFEYKNKDVQTTWMRMTSPVLIKRKMKTDKKGCCNWKKRLRQQKEVAQMLSLFILINMYIIFVLPVTALPDLCFHLLFSFNTLLRNWAVQHLHSESQIQKMHILWEIHCSFPILQSITRYDFLILTPAIFSLRVAASGQ